MINESCDLVGEIPSPLIRKAIVIATEIYMCVTNWGKLVLEIGAALFCYKLRQTLIQIGTASLLQIGVSVDTYWGSYYELGQPLLQNRTAFTNWGKIYYKLG